MLVMVVVLRCLWSCICGLCCSGVVVVIIFGGGGSGVGGWGQFLGGRGDDDVGLGLFWLVVMVAGRRWVVGWWSQIIWLTVTTKLTNL